MSARHRDPEYRKNARLRRQQINLLLKRGEDVACVDCGRPIQEGQTFDIGHLIDGWRGGGHELSNLSASHRKCNRSSGGKAGAAHTNSLSRQARGLPPL